MQINCRCVLILIFWVLWKCEAQTTISEDPEYLESTFVISGCSGETVSDLKETLKEAKQTIENVLEKLYSMEMKLYELEKGVYKPSIENFDGNLKEMMTEVVQTELKSFANSLGIQLNSAVDNIDIRYYTPEKKIEKNSIESLELKLNSTVDIIVETLQTRNNDFEAILKKDIDGAFKKQSDDFLKPLQATLDNLKCEENGNDKEASTIDISTDETSDYSSTPSYNTELANNCAEILNDFDGSDGIYELNASNLDSFQAYCIRDPLDSNSPAWTIIQRHVNDNESFDKNWSDYKNGFGDPKENFWLGLEHLYEMTSHQNYELWIEMKDSLDEKYDVKYNKFVVGSEKEGYPLSELGECSNNAKNGLKDNIGMKFSTKDADNDGNEDSNCAEKYGGGFWYSSKYCTFSNLNGKLDSDEDDSIYWYTTDSGINYLKYIQMAIRPTKLQL